MSLLSIAVLEYHNIDPEIFRIGPVAIRWYSLSYIAGLIFMWWWLAKAARREGTPFTRLQVDDFVLWAFAGVFLGGRLGYVLFYNLEYYLSNPFEILNFLAGGMSFHGGLVGVTLAIILFAKRRKINVFSFADYVATAVPMGLFFGRVANFINGELYGAPSNLPWAMPFPGGGPEPRHPSQLYEAFLEGLVLFFLLNFLIRRTSAAKFPGMTVGAFFIGYGFFRYLIEFVRVPDEHLGRLWDVISMGQLLSLPMILFGLWLIVRSKKVGPVPAAQA